MAPRNTNNHTDKRALPNQSTSKKEPARPCTSFVTLKLPSDLLLRYPPYDSSSVYDKDTGTMNLRSRNKQNKSLADSQRSQDRPSAGADDGSPANQDPASESAMSASSASAFTRLIPAGSQIGSDAVDGTPNSHGSQPIILKFRRAPSQRSTPSHPTPLQTRAISRKKQVTFAPSDQENETPPNSDSSFNTAITETRNSLDDLADMSGSPPPPRPERPTLKISFSKPAIPQTDNTSAVQTPAPQSAIRTPSIKLKFGGGTPLGPPTPASATSVKRKSKAQNDDQSGSVKKKQKRQSVVQGSEDELSGPASAPARPKITFKNSHAQSSKTAQTPAPIIKLKQKGKVPKRPVGVGYDSELDERENDPVILEGFILRMEPGPDCDYLRKAVEEGTLGLLRTEKGPAISIKMLDHLGRRGILKIKDNSYATSLVDLPCIIEGMKSWDKKSWIKSIDVSQMLLVLGKCSNEEEAKNYPLPPDVDEKTYQYAHGITAPMKWVRKRRFNRTKRARVDDIEAVERRVAQLLEQDKAATTVNYQVLDHDPRGAVDENESAESDYDEDAEGEDDDMSGYFDNRNGQQGDYVETPMELDAPAEEEEEIGEDELADLEGMFDEPVAPTEPSVEPLPLGRLAAEGGDSSLAVTSNSASPMVTAAPTPASAHEHSSDEDEDDEDEGDDDDIDDAQKEEDEEVRNARERVADFAAKIKEQENNLAAYDSIVLRRKIQRTIEGLKGDMVTWKKRAGIPLDDDEE
ncbi:hypothetical protein PV10_06375 [Exophiala mesophila]|uniref:TAFII55 protein conserved region domain-containing protein n=1 Tax=Exophiala mesophila TaxID=212818 RepID=A0A0D1ZD70_EXOME|nr:uncharacterized protein PV10_06375 [Exophiala mesophila]KIV91884.1 hypothetical protein PV10_06375 [Exophiala mesophila]